jgi:hypothetical protein
VSESKEPSGLKSGGKRLWRRVISGWNPPEELWNLLENLCRAIGSIASRESLIVKARS